MIRHFQLLFGRLTALALGATFRRRANRTLYRIGTQYGGWHCDPKLLRPGSVAVCAGAGEDISFDVHLNGVYGLRIICIDPTPRAVDHVRRLLDYVRGGDPVYIDGGSEAYDVKGFELDRFEFHSAALWNEETTLKLFEPHDPTHVSYSALNLQRTTRYIEVPTRRLNSLLNGSSGPLAVLKLDIEGAEYAVLDDMLATKLFPNQLLVEFDELHHPKSPLAPVRIARRIVALSRSGYRLVHIEGANFVFIRCDQ